MKETACVVGVIGPGESGVNIVCGTTGGGSLTGERLGCGGADGIDGGVEVIVGEIWGDGDGVGVKWGALRALQSLLWLQNDCLEAYVKPQRAHRRGYI